MHQSRVMASVVFIPSHTFTVTFGAVLTRILSSHTLSNTDVPFEDQPQVLLRYAVISGRGQREASHWLPNDRSAFCSCCRLFRAMLVPICCCTSCLKAAWSELPAWQPHGISSALQPLSQCGLRQASIVVSCRSCVFHDRSPQAPSAAACDLEFQHQRTLV